MKSLRNGSDNEVSPVGPLRQLHAGRTATKMARYQLTDCLHEGRSVLVPSEEIARTVSTWLAELDVDDSPLIEDLARAVFDADWQRAHAIGEQLSVDVFMVA